MLKGNKVFVKNGVGVGQSAKGDMNENFQKLRAAVFKCCYQKFRDALNNCNLRPYSKLNTPRSSVRMHQKSHT